MTEVETFQIFREKSKALEISGIAMVKIPGNKLFDNYDVVFQKGMGLPLIQNIMELYQVNLQEA